MEKHAASKAFVSSTYASWRQHTANLIDASPQFPEVVSRRVACFERWPCCCTDLGPQKLEDGISIIRALEALIAPRGTNRGIAQKLLAIGNNYSIIFVNDIFLNVHWSKFQIDQHLISLIATKHHIIDAKLFWSLVEPFVELLTIYRLLSFSQSKDIISRKKIGNTIAAITLENMFLDKLVRIISLHKPLHDGTILDYIRVLLELDKVLVGRED